MLRNVLYANESEAATAKDDHDLLAYGRAEEQAGVRVCRR